MASLSVSKLFFKGVIKLNIQEEVWGDLFELRDDIEEWLQLLEEKARNGPESIWGNLNTEAIIKLTYRLLKKFEATLAIIQNNDKRKREFESFKLNTHLILRNLRKERSND
jgi:hypothetical protein